MNSFGYGGTNAHAILDDAGHFLEENGFDGLHNTTMHVPRLDGTNGSLKGYHNGFHNTTTNGAGSEKANGCLNGHHSTQLRRSSETLSNGDAFHPARLFVFSAHDELGIPRMAKRYVEHFYQDGNDLSDRDSEFLIRLAYTLSEKRSRLNWKSFVVASSIDQLSQNLSSPVIVRQRSSDAPRIAFLFTGQGAQ